MSAGDNEAGKIRGCSEVDVAAEKWKAERGTASGESPAEELSLLTRRGKKREHAEESQERTGLLGTGQ